MLFSLWRGHILTEGHVKPEPRLYFPHCCLLGWASHCLELNARRPRRALRLGRTVHTIQSPCSVEMPQRKYLVDHMPFFLSHAGVFILQFFSG